jgi:hypothetical protein
VSAAPRVPSRAPWEQRGGPSEEEQSRSPRITPVDVEGWSPLLKREVRNVGFLKSLAQLISKSLGSRREHRFIGGHGCRSSRLDRGSAAEQP